MHPSIDGNDAGKHTSFAEQYIVHQERLRGYVSSLVTNWSDAEEVFQRTSLCLWRKWDSFDASRGFLPWAFGVARIEAKSFLSEKGRRQQMLSDAAMEALEGAIIQNSDVIDDRLSALEHCVNKLQVANRALLRALYQKNASIEQAASSFGLTPNAVYKRVRKIRELLHRCIDRQLSPAGDQA
ncbi:sigma-70 family RNA polymerase sigma factor [Blastopirellula sp. J2-11]|uniref:sigma-70 family RNA polymerase sigma factor n=1 Tax=Blastopirellula sp. J2-11 TaxID=2943192 RepID=UPI0021CA2E4B|nr:sigma-70 family RNA polymerase sigma factor [Blastopirellula sp. J2-11]UUO08738.1 sigma-70 family RNA polymerase sigma factor [Blastopirellula sp. J2-11]